MPSSEKMAEETKDGAHMDLPFVFMGYIGIEDQDEINDEDRWARAIIPHMSMGDGFGIPVHTNN